MEYGNVYDQVDSSTMSIEITSVTTTTEHHIRTKEYSNIYDEIGAGTEPRDLFESPDDISGNDVENQYDSPRGDNLGETKNKEISDENNNFDERKEVHDIELDLDDLVMVNKESFCKNGKGGSESFHEGETNRDSHHRESLNCIENNQGDSIDEQIHVDDIVLTNTTTYQNTKYEPLSHNADSQHQASSGKFVLRSSRHADPIHVIRTIVQVTSSNQQQQNPEMDQLITVLRGPNVASARTDDTTDQHRYRRSVITSALVQQFEHGSAADGSRAGTEVNVFRKTASDDLSPKQTTVMNTDESDVPDDKVKVTVLCNLTSSENVSTPDTADSQSVHGSNSTFEERTTLTNGNPSNQVADHKQPPSNQAAEHKQPDIFIGEDIESRRVVGTTEPVWMKNALEKQRRAADIVQAEGSGTKIIRDETTIRYSSPWAKEIPALRRVTVTSQHPTTVTPPSIPSPPASVPSPPPDPPSSSFETSISEEVVVETVHEVHTEQRSAETHALDLCNDNATDDNDTPQDLPNGDDSSFTPEVEKCEIDAAPLVSREDSNEVFEERKVDPAPAPTSPVQSPSPTLHITTISNNDKQEASVTSPDVLPWMVDIEVRRKTKSYIVTQKPDQPLRLGEMPEWKKQLQEKNKLKRQSFDYAADSTVPPEAGQRSAEVTDDGQVPAWKLEILQARQSMSSSELVDAVEELPEWARLAEEKRNSRSSESAETAS